MLKEDVVTDVCLDSGISLNPILKDVKDCVSNISINELYYSLIFIDILKACTCNQYGTVGNLGCNVYTGECVCKRNVIGRDCNQCAVSNSLKFLY